jgi:uncharacterized protein
MTASAIYEGTIRHRRFAVRGHSFRHRVAMAYVDLSELDVVPWRLRRGDYLGGDPSVRLADAARALVGMRCGVDVSGPVRLLTLPHRFGVGFNPVSFYYCFSTGPEERLEAIIAEVTSTPWGEQHSYVLTRTGPGPVLSAPFAKRMHVSPFMGMDQAYVFRAATPGKTLSVQIESSEGGRSAFDATLSLRRVELRDAGRVRPTPPAQVLAMIYGHAAALKLKGVPVHRRPEVGV